MARGDREMVGRGGRTTILDDCTHSGDGSSKETSLEMDVFVEGDDFSFFLMVTTTLVRSYESFVRIFLR